MIIAAVTILALIAGALYRMGGYGKPFNTKHRDLGVPTCMILAMLAMGNLHWSLILCFGAMFGAMTTYWDWLNKYLPVKDKGKEYWWNWALTGFFYGLSMLPYAIATSSWYQFICFLPTVTLLTVLISEMAGDVNIEETGRGAIVVGSLIWFIA